jgi:peptidoglycan hydrolase-like protein with peptidoglycan-binding domain
MSTQTKALPTLSRGSKGQSVHNLQDLLNQADRKASFGNPPPLAVDGDFGPQTEKAVKSYQRYYGLLVDGIVGPQTWSSLHAVVKG